MTEPEDGDEAGERAVKPARLYFITDPICAWCWGMLPEVEALAGQLAGKVELLLRCAGLQVGHQGSLSEADREYLLALWQEVGATTGQTFSGSFPQSDTFIYHSEIPCRLLTLARRRLGAEPWPLFHDLQEAFYAQAKDITSQAVLTEIAKPHGLAAADLTAGLSSQETIAATRAEFAWCRQQIAHRSLPTLLLDLGQGPTLLCGGYATADFLQADIAARLATAQEKA